MANLYHMLRKMLLLGIHTLGFTIYAIAQSNGNYSSLNVHTLKVRNGADDPEGWGYNDARVIDQRPNHQNGGSFIMNHHFGLTFSAHSYYGGIRFYNQAWPSSPYDAATGAKMVMSITDGNVGIGTTTPQARLQLKNGFMMASDLSFDNINVKVDGTNIPSLRFTRWTGGGLQQHNAFAGQFYNTALDEYSFAIGTGSSNSGDQNSSSTVLTATLNGNVGIGTLNPSTKLAVLGDIVSNSNVGVVDIYSNTSNAALKLGLNTEYAWLQSHNSRPLRINELGNDVYLNTNGGNVGIGTTTPGSYKLAVEGKVGARKIVVTQTPTWPDYVFATNYKLPTLQEVEAFIKQHKHLPDVPSAKEVETQGLDLGDTQAVLLQKIEELTLYVIELKKEIDQLKKK